MPLNHLKHYANISALQGENTTIWNAINTKLNISDQRYNDTQFVINKLLDYYNKSEVDSLIINFLTNETDPIFIAENSSLWNAIMSKLNITDERYNDTSYINNRLLNYDMYATYIYHFEYVVLH